MCECERRKGNKLKIVHISHLDLKNGPSKRHISGYELQASFGHRVK